MPYSKRFQEESLLTRLGRLKSVQATVTGEHDEEQLTLAPLISTPYVPYEPPSNDWEARTAEVTFDKHFFMAHANPTCWQFFGSSSVYSLAVEVLVHARAKFGPITQGEDYNGPQFWLNAQPTEKIEPALGRQTPDVAEVNMLVRLFLTTTNVQFQSVDETTVDQDIAVYLENHQRNARALTGNDAHAFFRTSMMCAIAAANKARHRPHYSGESILYYAEALQCVEEVTSDVSVEALVALILLIAFSLNWPRKGDVWKLLDFACRLSVELNYHTETNDRYEDEPSRKRRRAIFWGVYTVERTIGQHLGRPSDLPEEIITAEYPTPLNAVNMNDPSLQQQVLTSHYYRLTYLRSEIFREVYLPAVAPDLPQHWYEQRLESILAWREELPHELQAGPGGFTCEMGVHSSIVFLFQPLLLRALNATRDATLPQDSRDVIPRESYHSACQVIQQYARILSAPEDHPDGMYPVTIVSAHYIQTAALAIMAHCVLALDGRLPTMSFVHDPGASLSSIVDFRDIHDVSELCMRLLNTLAEMWKGMVGIRDIYHNLASKVLPALARSGQS